MLEMRTGRERGRSSDQKWEEDTIESHRLEAGSPDTFSPVQAGSTKARQRSQTAGFH